MAFERQPPAWDGILAGNRWLLISHKNDTVEYWSNPWLASPSMRENKNMRGIIYLSAPLFTQVERRWNRELASAIEKRMDNVRVILPQDIRIHRRYNDPRNFAAMFRKCVEALESAHAVVAILDGPDADSGVAFEVGYARAKGKPIVGVRTDFRKNQDRGLNMMVGQALTRFCPVLSFNEDVETLATEIVKKIRAAWGSGGRTPNR